MLTTATVTPYDAIRYPGRPYAETHPDRLAAAATFHGLTPAPPDRCRVLEVGCGDGGNLVPMAYGLPASTFTGIDLAGDAIEAARAFAQRTGVCNAAFDALDLGCFPESAGAFDYIIAHGVYSWIPAEVRDALMALIGRHLAPHGVAFVSYNTFPGCHQRRMVWEMLKFHTSDLDDPEARLTEARALLHLVAHGNAHPDVYTQPLITEARRMEDRVTALLFHDDLSSINDPVYFHEFADHAARHGLQYLAEAAFVTSSYAGISPEARGVLAALDPITRQQYLDFIKCRRFRQTLLCHDTVALDRIETPARMQSLLFTAARRVRIAPQDDNAPPDSPQPTATDDDGVVLMQAMQEVLRGAAPHALPFSALVDAIRARPDAGQPLAPGNIALDAVMLASLQAGVIEPHVIAPRLACPPGERPVASAVVRAQLADGDLVTSLWHQLVKIDDDVALRLLPLCDGTRGREELRMAMGELIGSGAAGANALDGHLLRLARLGLLVA
ncbi:MAG: class I SAM-dependent methyltransferase [Casimicrobiaceae bacterium]